jgi:hypothetical protein
VATTTITGAGLGSALSQLLMCDDLEPGSDLSYQTAKVIYTHHPLGKKLADAPIVMAQSQPRDVAVSTGPDRVREAFLDQWEKDGCDSNIFNVASLSRVYGVAAVALLTEGEKSSEPIDYAKLADKRVAFNVFDPLNMAGSFNSNLDPNSMDFMKHVGITVAGQPYHRSRFIVKMNERPIYLEWTNSSFGWVGRSVYQRALYPLKSFIDTMVADSMVARKAGLLVAKMIPPGSIADRLMQFAYGIKRAMIQWGRTDNVLGITPEESLETLDMKNVNAAMEVSRRNILNNTAVAADMPAIIINSETYAQGFGEGNEDALNVARYIKGVRDEFKPVYDWFDLITMYRAWNPEFYKTIQREYPAEYGEVSFDEAFTSWRNAFKAVWPSLVEEPESEKIKVDDAKLKAIIALIEVLMPALDPENKSVVIEWAADNFNSLERLFKTPLDLDYEALANYEPPAMEAPEEPGEPRPFAAQDSASAVRALKRLARVAA